MNSKKEQKNLKTVWRESANRLRKVGIKTPLLDARVLLQEVLKINYETLLTSANRVITPEEIEQFDELIGRRLKREPVAKILGYKEFWSMKFKTTKDTLDPRPESETLVEAVIRNNKDRKKELKILDLGTGSGCLILSLLKEFPNAKGLGVDISIDALRVAAENSEELGLDERVNFIQSNWLKNVKDRFDIIISNPPYIKTEAIDFLPAEARLYDPKIALDGGRDGMKIYRELLPEIPEKLSLSGKCYFEIGKWQDHLIEDLLKENGYEITEVINDLAGIPRVIGFQKPYLKVVK